MKLEKRNKILIWPVILLITGLSFSQEFDSNIIEKYLNNLELDSAEVYIKSINRNLLSIYHKGNLAFYEGIVHKKRDRHLKAYQAFKFANDNFAKVDSLQQISEINYEIYDLLNQQNSLKIDSTPYLDEFINYAKSKNEPLLLARAYSKIAGLHWGKEDYIEAKRYYKKSLTQLKIINDTLRINSIKMNIGSVNISSKDGDSALYYYKQTLPYFLKIENTNLIANNYNNQARAYEILKDTITAINYYQKALDLDLKEYDKKTTVIILGNLIRCYKTIDDFKNAFKYADELILLNENIDDSEQNQALIDAEKKYRASEKEKENILLQSEIEKEQRYQRYLWVGGIIILLVGSVFGFLIYNNIKRKQLIAEQEREIEIRKSEKVLKEQELTTINAMIAGQEKERQRIASDLHDSVGATLSAVRLQFEHLHKQKDSPINKEELFANTSKLLEEAYNKVRSMAHIKNSGVLAKKGLLIAVEKLAKSASGTNQLQISVQDYGLEGRLANSIEITIFRIIQELVTNIIKHSKATEATISITQYKDSINIIVEDDGQGFDFRKTHNKDGMGLSSIEKRVEHLEGNMEVDSSPGNGTSILIDIPL